MRFGLLASALLTLIAAAPAQAGWKIDRAQAIAAKVWHQPCHGQVSVRWAPTPQFATIASTSGPPSITVDSGPWVMGWSDPARCAVYLPADLSMDWWDICATVIHEYGHLAGYRDPTNTRDPYHSRNPRSIMYADIEPWHWRCDHRGRTYLGLDRRSSRSRRRGD